MCGKGKKKIGRKKNTKVFSMRCHKLYALRRKQWGGLLKGASLKSSDRYISETKNQLKITQKSFNNMRRGIRIM